ncbi:MULTISPECIES: DUF986 family protein [Brenneria]|uniref:UPF0266 membrane protein DDT54_07680 n=1 Tax=Brenneria nigrifluens DSM 30175 = ATCC 13028 TaxID=1121120 RepID=A0A2U1UT35_9GAMM|nr:MULTISPECIES: DUF986 family protein [Brenneria]EHD21655.1 UPF0266 membrane protein yobD [Brenneria sp. EniD312]PWC24804.1 DUF986 domain-containing protein [Brenneria nigrifluens DSM 30175 = ATCC 13028]QCR04773.1 DUF986 domain-containing protein [Brenneria nigrifluens DSM 30175 = ATCC 13028]
MTVTDIALVILIALALIYAIYDEFIMEIWQGKTRLRVALKRVNRLDALIFIGLVIILIYQNVMNNGAVITSSLLLFLAFMAIYLAYIRRPKLLFKPTGFFYANIFIPYNRIKNMNLSEDGVLVIDLERRRLLIQVEKLDDLEKIYNFMVENQ